MAEPRQTTIRFSEPIYRRLEAAGEITGLPMNSIVVVACLEWLDAHQPEGTARFEPVVQPSHRARSSAAGMYPFDRFAESAKTALTLAQGEAERMRHSYIGTEHLLLALLRVEEGVAARVLKNLGADLETVRPMVESLLGPTAPIIFQRPLPTSRMKRVIELSFEEAQRSASEYVHTEHLLVGLLRMKDGLGAHVLHDLGITAERVRSEIERLGASE